MKTEYGVAVVAGAVVVVGAAWYFFGQNDEPSLRMSTGQGGEPSASTGGEPAPEPQKPLPLRVAQAPASPEPAQTNPPSPAPTPSLTPAVAVPNQPTGNEAAATTPEAAGPRRSALANRRIALPPPAAPASTVISLPAVSDEVTTPSPPPAVAAADSVATPRTLLGSRTRGRGTPTPASSRPAVRLPIRPATSRPAGGTQYVIQAGDRLAILAELHYGHQSFLDVLLAANPHIKDANRIFAGMKIVIPPKPASTPAQRRSAIRAGRPAPTATPTRRAVGAGMYRVKRGDTLSELARKRYESAAKWRTILRLNRDLIPGDGSRLITGQIIRLPAQLPAGNTRASRPGG